MVTPSPACKEENTAATSEAAANWKGCTVPSGSVISTVWESVRPLKSMDSVWSAGEGCSHFFDAMSAQKMAVQQKRSAVDIGIKDFFMEVLLLQ